VTKFRKGDNMFNEKQIEIIHAVQETSSRFFNLEDLVVNKIPPQIQNADLYTLEEVAEIVSMSIVTIRQYVRTEKLKAIKQWKNWMVSSNEIARLLYERKHGEKIPTDETMLVVVDGELYEEDSYINQYQIITIENILNNVGSDFSFEIDRYIHSIIPNPKSGSVYIEAISNIENFYRRAGDVVFSDLNKIEATLFNFLPVNKKAIEYVKTNAVHLLEQNPNEALAIIKEYFGEPDDIQTNLKIFKALLDVCEELSKR
jgi:hypothetical protein